MFDLNAESGKGLQRPSPRDLKHCRPHSQRTGTDRNGQERTGTDLISRQAALDAIKKLEKPAPTAQHLSAIFDCEDTIKALPSAQPGWIPWDSGRFPEESGTYTVTAYDGATKRVTYAKYQKRLKRWELTGSRAYWRVLAWQPLPTPYREGGQE